MAQAVSGGERRAAAERRAREGTDQMNNATASSAMALPNITRLTGWGLGIVRILIGYLWYTQLLWKLPPKFGCNDGFVVKSGNDGLCDWIGREIENPKFGFYKSFLESVIAPNLSVMGYFIFLGEATIAVLLFFGVLTRLGGLLGFAMGLNLTIGLWNVPHEWYWTYVMLALLNLVFTLTAAGRWIGVDAFLHPRAVAQAEKATSPLQQRIWRTVALLT